MAEYRITDHPILSVEPTEWVTFTWQGQPLQARSGEVIASALFAHGIRIFGHHHRDGAPQGIFCANGQCAQCMVIADGKPVKACMTPVMPGMCVVPLEGLPELPEVDTEHFRLSSQPVETLELPVLILGGGPAGMSAALALAKHGVRTLLVDDKQRLGGKLVLQTHRFFGDINAVYAGTRGIDIAKRLETETYQQDCIKVWLNSTALAVFSDKTVGILRKTEDDQGHSVETYVLVKPQVLLVATGAREKSLVFRGNTLPGVYGAGAFQTLVNRDLVKAANRLFIVGGGNVGLIAGYHALQAGIQVAGLVEALPECGGYKVHRDKLARLGVPIYTSHTVISANGEQQVESVTIAQLDEAFHPIPGTEKTFACDTVLIAVGLEPVNEFTEKAQAFGMTVFDAGDAEEIAEASAAMLSGRIRGLDIARAFGVNVKEVSPELRHAVDVLKSRPGAVVAEHIPEHEQGVMPVFHCSQEIPCNPCTSVCPQHLIHIDAQDIRAIPEFLGPELGKACLGCERCVTICPGLAITLVDYREDATMPTVTLAYEFPPDRLQVGETVTVLDTEGAVLGAVKVTNVRAAKRNNHTVVVKVKAPKSYARRIAGIRVASVTHTRTSWEGTLPDRVTAAIADEEIVCRCERVTAGEIRALIRKGYRDMNEIKAVTRAGMGACGGKTCAALIQRLFREEGVGLDEVTANVQRPLFIEVPFGVFAGGQALQGESQALSIENQETCPHSSWRSRIKDQEACPRSLWGSRAESYGSRITHYDVIIVGAGSVGVPAALAMAEAGVKVLVLDRFASQGQGSNKSAIGGVRATHSDPAKIRLCLRSLEIFSTWEQTYGHDIEWTTGGYSFVAYREEEKTLLQELLRVQQAYGLDIAWYDRVALLDIVPGLNADGLLGGTYSPGDGHCSPLLAGHAFYDAAKRAGAVFHFNEAVKEILTKPKVTGAHREVIGVRTDHADYHAPIVVNAAGSWAAEVGRLAGINHPISSESHEAGITEPVAHFLNPLMVDIRPAPGSKNYYFFQLGSGQVVFCITPNPPVLGFDRRATSEFLPLVAPRMVGLMPRLSNIRVRRTWRGLYPMSPDGVPLVGWARELEGYLMAIGMCGQGFMLGPGLGELLARMVTRDPHPEDREVLHELRPYRAFAGQEALK